MNLSRTRSLSVQIYKTINNSNPKIVRNLLKVCKTNRFQEEQFKVKLQIPKSNQVSFATKSLCIQDPRIWNFLKFYIKSQRKSSEF